MIYSSKTRDWRSNRHHLHKHAITVTGRCQKKNITTAESNGSSRRRREAGKNSLQLVVDSCVVCANFWAQMTRSCITQIMRAIVVDTCVQQRRQRRRSLQSFDLNHSHVVLTPYTHTHSHTHHRADHGPARTGSDVLSRRIDNTGYLFRRAIVNRSAHR